MSTQDWTTLVQRVDLLITELHAARTEAKRWQARAAELERLQPMPKNSCQPESLPWKTERKKTVAVLSRILAELDKVQAQLKENNHV